MMGGKMMGGKMIDTNKSKTNYYNNFKKSHKLYHSMAK